MEEPENPGPVRLPRSLSVLASALLLVQYVMFFIWSGPRPTGLTFTGDAHFRNRLEQDGTWSWFYALILLTLLFTLRGWMLTRLRRKDAAFWFAMLILASVPYILLLVSVDWTNPYASYLLYCIGASLALLFVPSVGCLVLVVDGQLDARKIWVHSLVEAFVLLPLWAWGLWPLLTFIFI